MSFDIPNFGKSMDETSENKGSTQVDAEIIRDAIAAALTDSSTVEFSGVETISAAVKISPDAGNQATVLPNGIFVAPSQGGGANFLRSSSFANLAALINAVGNTPSRVVLDSALPATIPSIVPITLIFDVVEGVGKFVKSGTGAIQFAGKGLVNANLRDVVFQGFAETEIKWTGRKYPSPISTAIFEDDETGDLNVLLTKACEALIGRRATVCIYENGSILSSDGVFKSQSIIRQNLRAKLMNGFYTTNAPQNEAPIAMENFTSFVGESLYGVQLRENQHIVGDANVPDNHRFTLIAAAHMATAPFDFSATNTNIEIANFSIVGFNGHLHHSNGSASAIQLGNVHNARIHDLHFDGIHAYAVYCGGMGTTGNCADTVEIWGITCENMISQHVGCVNGRNITLRDSKFKKTGNPLSVSCAIVDFEPNEWDTVLENITIDNCEFDTRGSLQSHYAIVVQRSGAKWARNVYITNNKIISYDRGGNGFNLMVVGIQLEGIQDGVVAGNSVQGGNRSVTIIDSINVKFQNNNTKFSGSQDGAAWWVQGCANCEFTDNTHNKVGAGLQGDRLHEVYGAEVTVNVNGNQVQFTPPNYFHEWQIGLPVEIDGVMVSLTATPNNPLQNYAATINQDLGVRNNVSWKPKFGNNIYARNHFAGGYRLPEGSTSRVISTRDAPGGDPLPAPYGGDYSYTA